MLISHDRKVLFVHIQKTGGSSITEILAKNIPDIYRYKAKHEFAIIGMEDLKEWDRYFKFAFVRNPWDRLVSWYTMINNARRVRWHETLLDSRKKKHYRQVRENKLWRYVFDNSSTFKEFVKNCIGRIEIERQVFYSFAFNQLDYISDSNGKLIVDFVGRYENYDRDLREVLRRLEFNQECILQENRSVHNHYHTYYSPEMEEIVRDRFRKDIEYFGYEFEVIT